MNSNLRSLLLFCFLIFLVFIIPIYRPVGFAIYFRLALILYIIFQGSILFHFFFIKRIRKKFTNVGAICFSLFITLFILEMVFMFIPKSHGVGHTLGARIWMEKYWNPINSLGFRDVELSDADSAILFVGDSFTAGHGLKNVSERYSDIFRNGYFLEKKKDVQIINLGQNGIDTQYEFELMVSIIQKTKIKPSIVILQYYGNDIQKVAIDNGVKFKGFTQYEEIPLLFQPIIRGSYLLNYLYWIYPQSDTESYIKFLTQAYKTKEVVNLHKKDLQLFIKYATSNNIELIPIVFPFLTDIEMSESLYVNEMIAFFESFGLNTMNVSKMINQISIEKRVVNLNDVHASKYINLLVAQELLKIVSSD